MPTETTDTQKLPLCVDLDGSLYHTDTLWESCLLLIARNPLYVLMLPFWLLGGKAAFKHQISQRVVSLPYETLPENTALIAYLKGQKQVGRKLVLVTAANQKIAQGVAEHLELFDTVLASDENNNLSGKKKALALCELFGEKGFVYAANAPVDLAIWKHAAAAITVNAKQSLVARVSSQFDLEKDFPANSENIVRSSIRAMRPYQWVKNLLLLVPLILSHKLEPELIVISLLAFIAFCLTASAIYIINDLFDLESDRGHKTKKTRPFAAGTLSIGYGITLSSALIAISILIALTINFNFFIILLLYLVITTTYTLLLKHIALIDVLTLTSLYTIRISAGAYAVNVEVSYWLLAFSVFIFLSLGLTKRYIELLNLFQDNKEAARDYTTKDLPVLLLFGVCSGFNSVLVLILYINDLHASKLYNYPSWLWIVAMTILYWINRIWLLAHRGVLNEDPVMFAIHDRISYMAALLIISCLYLAV